MNDVDKRIALHVFGLSHALANAGGVVFPKYSSDLNEAWTVVEHVFKNGGKLLIETWPNGYAAMASRDWKTAPMHWARGDSAPEAICAAVLKAYEEA